MIAELKAAPFIKRTYIKTLTIILSLFACLLVLSSSAEANITLSKPLKLLVLYDGSGSMYPGYKIGGARRNELGVKLVHQYPAFRTWLVDLIRSMRTFNGAEIAIDAFYNLERVPLQPNVPLDQLDLDKAFALLDRKGAGQMTFLAENLERLTRGYEGLVWLITDNVVDTRPAGPEIQDVAAFFKSLKEDRKYLAVHLYKYPFEVDGHSSNLAVYGIMVSPEGIDTGTADHFDRIFYELAERFPGKEHLKLKDLNVNPISIEPAVEVIVEESKRKVFGENQKIRLEFKGVIQSNLTQHTVTGGQLSFKLLGPLQPASESKKAYGVKEISSSSVAEYRQDLAPPIPPRGNLPIHAVLSSKRDVSMATSSFWNAIKMAWAGAVIKYAGTADLGLSNVMVHLERDRLAGVYGIDQASSVFNFQDVKSLSVQSRTIPVEFLLRVAPYRSFLLLAVLSVLVLLFGLPFLLLAKKSKYKVVIEDEHGKKSEDIQLRRLQGHTIRGCAIILGRLQRGLVGERFYPNRKQAGLSIEEKTEATGRFKGEYIVTIATSGTSPAKTCIMTITSPKGPVGGGASGTDARANVGRKRGGRGSVPSVRGPVKNQQTRRVPPPSAKK